VAAEATLQLAISSIYTGADDPTTTLREAARLFAQAGDDGGLAKTWLELMWVLHNAGEDRRALDLAPVAEAAVIRAGSPVDLAALAALTRGTVLQALGRYEEAFEQHQRSLELYRQSKGPDHPWVAHALNNMANLLHDMGRFETALEYHQQALAIREKALGEDHPEVANSLNNMGNTLRALGRLDEARTTLERALAIREKALGEDHFLVQVSELNLAKVLLAEGRPGEARPLLEEVAEAWRASDHPGLAHPLYSLAEVARAQGRLDDAVALLEEALAIREERLGPDHPDTVATRDALAASKSEAGG
jgi:tetratricopeptide (TPR) repeat protein